MVTKSKIGRMQQGRMQNAEMQMQKVVSKWQRLQRKWEKQDAEKENLIRFENSAYHKLKTAYEHKKYCSVIWDDPNIPNVRYYGEVEAKHHINNDFPAWNYYDTPVLTILQDYGDSGECKETVFSIRKQTEWEKSFEADLS